MQIRRLGSSVIDLGSARNRVPPILPATGLRLDLNAQVGVFQDVLYATPAVNDGDPVGGWQDQSGNAQHVIQAVAGKRPLLRLSAVSGKPALEFDGSDDALNSGVNLSSIISASAYSVYIVALADAIDTNNAASANNDALISNIVGGTFGVHLKSTPTVVAYNNDLSDDSVAQAISLGAWFGVHARHESGNLYISVNQAAESSVASGNTLTLTNLLGVGENNLSTRFLDGRIARILIYNVAHDAATRTQVYEYLRDLYGVP